jgi:nitrite reductase/ring-hydroxylating ferredoxin subunit
MGDRLAEAGTIAAVPTALTGLTDFSTFPEWSATPATIHGAMNIVNIGLYALSVRERRRGNHGRGVAISMVAIGLSCISGWLGGMLVYKDKVGVDHRDRFEGPKNWTPVLDEDELKSKTPKRIEVDGKPVMLYRDGHKVYAIGAKCEHAGGPLNEGDVKNGCVTCPWHHSVFDMRDGRVVHGPATLPQSAFAARLRNGRVELRLVRG